MVMRKKEISRGQAPAQEEENLKEEGVQFIKVPFLKNG